MLDLCLSPVSASDPDTTSAFSECGAPDGGGERGVTTDDEPALIARLRRGDGAAFDFVVREYGPRMAAVARRYLHCEADVDDAVQEAFASAFSHLGSFKGESRLSTWLHRIVVNAALMSRRRRSRRRELLSCDAWAPGRGDETGDLGAQSVCARGGASGEASAPERGQTSARAQDVLARLRALPECHREVLELRHVVHLSTDQAAGILGITPGALKTKLHRAKSALRGVMGRGVEGRGPRVLAQGPSCV